MGVFKKKEVTSKKEITNEKKVIEMLNAIVEDSSIKGNILYIKDIELIIEVSITKVNDRFLQVIFILNNDKFDEALMEYVSSTGKNINEMMEQVVASFASTILFTVVKALKNKDGIDVETPYYDKNKNFKLYKSRIVADGEKSNDSSMDYWEMLGDEIKKRLGNKRVYLIKIYAEKTDASINCECRINGLINKSISKVVEEFARKWEIKQQFYCEKQFFILIQDESTFVPYKFTKVEVNEFISKSIKIYEKCYLEDKYENLMDEIFNITNDINLTSEIFCFLPEIFCELAYHKVNFQDAFVLFQEDMEFCMTKNQLTSYNWMYENIYKEFKNNQFSQKQINDIVSYSAAFDAINHALKKGRKIDGLNMTALGLNVSDEYRPF